MNCLRATETTTTKISVLLVDDHTMVRQGLRALLEVEEDLSVVGEAENGRQALQMAKRLQPDVVVMDIAMPALNGLEATRQISVQNPKSKVVVLSSYNDDEYVQQLTAAGASGYLVKQTAGQNLTMAIREANKGKSFFSPSISKRMLDQRQQASLRGEPAKRGGRRLTPREMEVLQLVAEGHGNKQIAAELLISIKTVEKHRQQVMNKLDIHDVAGLTRYAVTHGIVENPTMLDTNGPSIASDEARRVGYSAHSDQNPKSEIRNSKSETNPKD